jgi:hypothetical protein
MATPKLTLAEIETLSRTGSRLTGRYEVRCLGLTMGRYATLAKALDMARHLERQTDARVTVH